MGNKAIFFFSFKNKGHFSSVAGFSNCDLREMRKQVKEKELHSAISSLITSDGIAAWSQIAAASGFYSHLKLHPSQGKDALYRIKEACMGMASLVFSRPGLTGVVKSRKLNTLTKQTNIILSLYCKSQYSSLQCQNGFSRWLQPCQGSCSSPRW